MMKYEVKFTTGPRTEISLSMEGKTVEDLQQLLDAAVRNFKAGICTDTEKAREEETAFAICGTTNEQCHNHSINCCDCETSRAMCLTTTRIIRGMIKKGLSIDTISELLNIEVRDVVDMCTDKPVVQEPEYAFPDCSYKDIFWDPKTNKYNCAIHTPNLECHHREYIDGQRFCTIAWKLMETEEEIKK